MSNVNSDNERSGHTTPRSEYYEDYYSYEQLDPNPTSQVLIDLMNKFNRLLTKKEINKLVKDDGSLGKFDIDKIMSDIQAKESFERDREKIEREHHMNEEGKKIEKRMRDRKLEPTMLLQRYSPPRNFSPRDTLHDSHKSSTASRMFPKDSCKFSGTHNSPSLSEFLCNMEVAQNACRLSEKEFKERLLSCTSGNVHEYLYNAIKLDYSLDQIYKALESMFDSTPSPQTAKLCLYNFKAPKTFSFSHVLSQVQWLACIASNSSTNQEVNKISLSLEGCNALFRCMPAKSSDTIEHAYRNYLSEFCTNGRMPDFAEFTSYLSPWKALFDRDLAENGCEESEMYGGVNLGNNGKRNLSKFLLNGDYLLNYKNDTPRKSYKSNRIMRGSRPSPYPRHVHAITYVPPPKRYPKITNNHSYVSNKNQKRRTYNIDQRNVLARPNFNRDYKTGLRFNGYNPNLARNQKYDNRRKPNKLCILCNETSHYAHENCKFMRTADGKRQITLPSQAECAGCAQRFKIHVFHKESLCPLKRNDPLYIRLKTEAMNAQSR